MGQTYYNILKIEFTDKKKAAQALRDKIARGDKESTDYSLKHFKEIGIGTDTIDDLLKIFFGGWDGELKYEKKKLTSAFDARYGWEGVMMDAFEEIAPFLKDGSSLKIYPDSGCDYGKVSNGKVIWIS